MNKEEYNKKQFKLIEEIKNGNENSKIELFSMVKQIALNRLSGINYSLIDDLIQDLYFEFEKLLKSYNSSINVPFLIYMHYGIDTVIFKINKYKNIQFKGTKINNNIEIIDDYDFTIGELFYDQNIENNIDFKIIETAVFDLIKLNFNDEYLKLYKLYSKGYSYAKIARIEGYNHTHKIKYKVDKVIDFLKNNNKIKEMMKK